MKHGAGIIPLAADTGRVLLGERSRYCNEPDTWAGFGGTIERGETPLDAALREFAEEAGYAGPMRIVGHWQGRRGDTLARVFVGIVPVEFEPRLNWEHSMALWLEPTHLDPAKLHWTALGCLRDYLLAEAS